MKGHQLMASSIRDSTSFRRIDRQNNIRVLSLRTVDVCMIRLSQPVPSLFISEGRMVQWNAGITDKKRHTTKLYD